ncbi:MAG: PIN domain-containing protein [Gammaproteobacteria bacterium]|nr:PIN domain-containing protein [Gammaproteobacteria bacterium]
MIIPDTNVVSELMHEGEPNSHVLAWSDSLTPQRVCLTAISVAELRFGIHALPAGRKQEALSAARAGVIRLI